MAYNVWHMLKQLRNKRLMKRIIWGLAIVIIPPFVFWGAGSALRSRDKGPAYAGTIFGAKVSFDEYNSAWRAVKDQALMIYGTRFRDISDQLDLNRQAWDRLLLLKEAARERIRVSDRDVIAAIQKFPFFQSRGGFDPQTYNLVLRQAFGIQPRDFEEEIRDSLVIEKLRDQVLKNVAVTHTEIKDAYKRYYEKSTIAYIIISPERFKKRIAANESALKKYYRDNKESFRVDDQVNIEYLPFEFLAYEKDIQVTDDEVKKFYEDHTEYFDRKKTFNELKEAVKAACVQARAAQKALEAAEKADYALADASKPLEDVAKEYSLPVRETGFFTRDGMIPDIGWFPEIQKQAFRLKVGQRSELIKPASDMAKGFYIIKVKEKKDSYLPGYEEIRQKIETTLKDEKASSLAAKEARRLHRVIAELIVNPPAGGRALSFEEAAAKVLRSPHRSEPFARSGYVQGLGSASELGEDPFTATTKPGVLAPVAKTRAGFCIFTVAAIMPIDEKKFRKERGEFTDKVLESKKMNALNQWYAALLEKANLKSNIPDESQPGLP